MTIHDLDRFSEIYTEKEKETYIDEAFPFLF
jgi:hypothetical protein